ncbi:GTPase-associated protein 1-related protein [Streptomyces caatingaensis]|uniref:GTPase-associated protein 1-related protein n=1 Tax=Streptomyces caatingaensis TaxID=1678637 RepID=UPI0006727D84|nr:GTPase-associated protein 1-related protein [Streptomyces caatingaensis]
MSPQHPQPLQQLHYSRSSPDSAPRFTAASPDLPALLLGEIEPLLTYEPPDAVPVSAPPVPASPPVPAAPVTAPPVPAASVSLGPPPADSLAAGAAGGRPGAAAPRGGPAASAATGAPGASGSTPAAGASGPTPAVGASGPTHVSGASGSAHGSEPSGSAAAALRAAAVPSRGAAPRFPVVFGHHRLADGTRLLCRVVRTGDDPRGRRHPFHAHAVRLPPDGPLPGGLLPVEAWESPSWAERTPGTGVPEHLTALAPARRITKAGLLEFVRARAERLVPFLTDVRTLFRRPDAPQLLVIERDTDRIAHWIAVASAVLPRDLANRLTFTTYTRRPLLARQQIVGALPGAEFDYAHVAGDRRYRVHDCAGGHSSPARDDPDPWASVAARVLLADRPALFTEAVRLRTPADRDATHDAGRLAALALRDGIPLDAAGRTAAARWARFRATADRADRREPNPLLVPLLGALATAGPDRPPEEWAALAELAEFFAPLASQPPGERLRRDLRAELDRAAPGEPLTRVLGLARLAEALRADHTPVLTARLSAALLGDAAPDRDAVWAAVTAHPGLTAAVLGTLERTAATGDPASVVHLLTGGFPAKDLQRHPHLRMAAALADGSLPRPRRSPDDAEAGPRPGAPDGTGRSQDRIAFLAQLVRSAGRGQGANPSVLRTAFRLVWGSSPPTPAETAALLDALPAERHRAAGLDDVLVRSALESTPDDAEAPAAARILVLRCGPRLDPRRHAALLLLDQAGALADGQELPGFTARALSLREQARPLEPGIEDRLRQVLVRRLLFGDPCPDELAELAASGDEELLGAYAHEARGGGVDLALRRTPAFAAACFTAWHTAPGASGLWDDVRTTLLDDVLRPAVRFLPREHLDEIQQVLYEEDATWEELFQEWNRRPGVLGRLGALRRASRADRRAD